MKIIKIFFTGSAIVLAIMWIYLYPFHRIMAEIKFAQYIALQDIDVSDIKTKDVLRDYTHGGHRILVEYYSDEGNSYRYFYNFVYYAGKGKYKFHGMRCIVHRGAFQIDPSTQKERIKYPPVSPDWI